MTKKLIQHGNSAALILDKAILQPTFKGCCRRVNSFLVDI